MTMDKEKGTPFWMSGKKVAEPLFVSWFTEKHKMIFYGGNFFDENGIVDETVLRKRITEEISDYVEKDLALQVEKIIKAMQLILGVTELDKDINTVHLIGGDYHIDTDSFEAKTEISPNRLCVRYNPDAPEPEKFLEYMKGLFDASDISTVQESLGYCLIPSTICQFMLLLIGEGGEGKSVLGQVLMKMFGNSATKMKISTLVSNRFALANLENKLIMLDDDMQMGALRETDLIKEIITNEGRMLMENKNSPFHEGDVYVRIIAFSNGALDALFDKSDAFRRRQLVINVLPKDPDRVDDRLLSQKLEGELEGILMWMIEGLKRLRANGFNFTISERTLNNLHDLRRNDNNIILFLESENYLCFGEEETVSTKALYECYVKWCSDNFYEPFKETSFSRLFPKEGKKYGITQTRVAVLEGKRVRGHKGVSTRLNPGVPLI